MSQLNDISLVAQVVVFKNTRAFDQLVKKYQSLKTLKDVERTCITLFYMEDLSIDKIAGITGIPAGTVKSHLSRGKDKLATYLKQNGYDRNRQ